ncbi:MAG: hypothetical protein Q8L22_00345 [Reyranella sp.]|nr:hypothetical protein [Reyranella sp.]
MIVVPNSTFLDSWGNNLATAQQIATLADPTNTLANAQTVLGELFTSNDGTGTAATVEVAADGTTVTFGLMVNRANNNDPSALLASDWSVRQAALADQTTVWNTYGADPTTYNAVVAAVQAIVGAGALQAAADAGYVSNVQDRMIWMTLDKTQFEDLFGTPLLSVQSAPGDAQTNANIDQYVLAWGGDLSLPGSIAGNIVGLWSEQNSSSTTVGPVTGQENISNPPVLETTGVTLAVGPLGVGNAAPDANKVHVTSIALAESYNFPLAVDIQTPTIALVEGNVPDQAQLLASYNDYRTAIGLSAVTAAQFDVVSGTDVVGTSSGELTLDISVVAGAAPNSSQLLYADLGGTAFNAYQQAFFDRINQPGILTSSFAIYGQPTANSPFQAAFEQLFIDGALNNVSVHIAAGDSGSSANLNNGVANVLGSLSPAMALIVGGNSLANLNTAQSDPTLSSYVTLALQNDPATIFRLVASGLATLPANLANAPSPDPATTLSPMFQSVWNAIAVSQKDPTTLSAGLGEHSAGTGGVDISQAVPAYQAAFGLAPQSTSGTGRGTPDVSALSSGDTSYAVLNAAYVGDTSQPLFFNNGGTSAATPLWASLTAQFDAIFADQNLPNLGFYNDLLYTAAAIAPASFNDITLGNNTTSYYTTATDTGYYNPNTGTNMVPTGDGYEAAPGYDLASGLGSPNGLVLARTLTAIAQAQSHSNAPVVMDAVNALIGTSTVAQTLLVQNNLTSGSTVVVQVEGTDAVSMDGNSALGWTSRLAGQAVQGSYFDADLMPIFDGASNSVPYEIMVQAGDTLGVTAGGTALALYQESLTTSYGFVQYGNAAAGTISLARPVAIAETAGGASDQNVVVRIRQNGGDSSQLEIYSVDDLMGNIGGLVPGQAGYAAAAAARDYQTTTGTTVIAGPGQGNFAQVQIVGVDQGDILAMKFSDVTTADVYWAFSQANGGTNALFNYGFNTWGWDDRPVTGDHDFNDLVVQFDFVSTAGSGWLVS